MIGKLKCIIFFRRILFLQKSFKLCFSVNSLGEFFWRVFQAHWYCGQNTIVKSLRSVVSNRMIFLLQSFLSSAFYWSNLLKRKIVKRKATSRKRFSIHNRMSAEFVFREKVIKYHGPPFIGKLWMIRKPEEWTHV